MGKVGRPPLEGNRLDDTLKVRLAKWDIEHLDNMVKAMNLKKGVILRLMVRYACDNFLDFMRWVETHYSKEYPGKK